MTDCLFCKIMKGEIPCAKLYEDKDTFAFLDIAPVNKGHALVVPKKHYSDLLDLPDKEIASLFRAAKKVSDAVMKGVGCQGFNLGMNNGKAAGQLVMHAHLHIIPRLDGDGLRHWPGKKYAEGEAERVKEDIKKYL